MGHTARCSQQTRWWMRLVALVVGLSLHGAASAAFSGTDALVPAVARASGLNQSSFFSTLLLTNVSTTSNVDVQIQFYERDQSNTAPLVFNEILSPGETKRHDNAVQTLFGLTEKAGAFRVRSTGDILVSSRTYNLPASGRLEESTGVFIASVPAAFAIGQSETAVLQGVSQGGGEAFRYNFGLIETDGQPVSVRMALKDEHGATLALRAYQLPAWGQTQYPITDMLSNIATVNSRLEATVVSGNGRVIAYGTQTTNGSNDPSAFEMSFKSALLGGTASGVTSVNGFSGAVTLNAGANVTLTSSGNGFVISSSGNGSAGPSGPAGPQGPKGDKGDAGAQGPAGTIVFSGSGSASTASHSDHDHVAATWTGFGGLTVNSTNSRSPGLLGTGAVGVQGITSSSTPDSGGVVGLATSGGNGVLGNGGPGNGVKGTSIGSNGVYGMSSAGGASGVYGEQTAGGFGVAGRCIPSSAACNGVYGEVTGNAQGVGVYGLAARGGRAGVFSGDVTVTGSLSKGGGSFKIDHPLDPENKYLYHSFVESPDMKNVYDGVVVLDAAGMAWIDLPEWFDALNRDYRYQLTALGAPQPNLHVHDEMTNNRFRVAGGHSGMRVSWQVTGIRRDAWADANRIPVEEAKPETERGRFLHPKEHGRPDEDGIEGQRSRSLRDGSK